PTRSRDVVTAFSPACEATLRAKPRFTGVAWGGFLCLLHEARPQSMFIKTLLRLHFPTQEAGTGTSLRGLSRVVGRAGTTQRGAFFMKTFSKSVLRAALVAGGLLTLGAGAASAGEWRIDAKRCPDLAENRIYDQDARDRTDYQRDEDTVF